MNEALTASTSENEVQKIFFMMNPEKTSEPNVMTSLFFQRLWQVIKTYLLDWVNNFMRTYAFDQRFNLTNICLIPKAQRLTQMMEFRKISFCNVGYKVISKVLCQRLKFFR